MNPNFKPYLNDDFKSQVKDIIDDNAKDGTIKDKVLEQGIYEHILLDVQFECMKIAKEYMAEEGIVMTIAIPYKEVEI